MIKRYGRRSVEITHSDKIIFPESIITKGSLIDYYAQIAHLMIPFTKDRPLSMQRYPHGIGEEGFYQKNIEDYFPQWIKRVSIKNRDEGVTTYVVANDIATLVYLANQLCITPHLWLSPIDSLEYPDRMIFDLDPADDDFKLVTWTAYLIKNVLEELGLHPFVMTTGSRGLHIVVPLKKKDPFEVVREFAHDIGRLLEDQYPEKLTTNPRKDKRGNKLLIDYLRNSFGATAVAPFAVRAYEHAPVATPIAWDELFGNALASSRHYTIKNVFERIENHKDPWDAFARSAMSLSKAIQKIGLLK